MEVTIRLIFISALITFLIALQTRNRLHVYVGATMFLLVLLFPMFHTDESPVDMAATEYKTESTLIQQSAVLDRQAHHLLDNVPRTKEESADARKPGGEYANFLIAEQDWLTRAEHGKPLDSFVSHNASTAAIRIVAVDSFLSGAVQSAIEDCNDHDSALNIDLADKIIDDARKSLDGRGNPHFPTPDLSHELDDSDDCIDDQ